MIISCNREIASAFQAGSASNDLELTNIHVGTACNNLGLTNIHVGRASNDIGLTSSYVGRASNDQVWAILVDRFRGIASEFLRRASPFYYYNFYKLINLTNRFSVARIELRPGNSPGNNELHRLCRRN